MSDEIERLRAAGDALVAAVKDLPIHRFDQALAVINAMHDWETLTQGDTMTSTDITDITEEEECEHDEIDDLGDCTSCKVFVGFTCERCDASGIPHDEIRHDDSWGPVCEECSFGFSEGRRGHYNRGEAWL